MFEFEKLAVALGGAAVFVSIISFVIYIALFVIGYYLYCVTQEKIAAKLKVGPTWMAYVPFARNVERMKMAKMPMWKLMFVGSAFTMIFSTAIIVLIGFIFGTMNAALGFVIGAILYVAYLVFYIIESYKYYIFIADTFGFDRALSLTTLFIPLLGQVFIYLIAFSKRIQPNGGKAEAAAPAPVANNAAGSFNYSSVGASSVNGLEGVSGMYQGAQFKMNANDEFMIGRDGTLADIVISANSEKVSRRHCSVRYLPTNNTYEVTDYSSNGTFYGNTRLVKGQPISVPRGTVLVVGDKMNQFKLL